jgi:cytochrome P450
MRTHPHAFAAEAAARHGGLAAFRILHRRMLAVSHPDYIRHILVTQHERYERSFHYRPSQQVVGKGLITTDGAYWKMRRRQIQPAFRSDTVRRIEPAVHAAAGEMFTRWENLRRAGQPVPIVAEMQTLALTVICRALLSVGIDSAPAQRFANAVRDSLYVVRRRNTSLCPMPHWVPNGTNRALRSTRDVLDAFVSTHLQPRFHGGERRPDIAQALLDARDPETGEALPWSAILDETKTLFTAGFETTATSLAWALHRLSHAPEVASRWHAEIDTVLCGRAPTWDDLPQLVYTDQIVQETLRLHPPVYSLGRECVADDQLDGYTIRRGTTLLLSVYGAQRDPRFWPEPMQFNPDRFAPGASWPRHAFLPFAIGKHTCIGNTFAVAEATLALALIGQRYRLTATQPVDIPVRAQVTLVPATEIPIRIEPRP